MSYEVISVIGLGYIGLPTAAMFASKGKRVIGVDVNPRAVDTINRGEIHIVEPGLDVAVRKAVKDGLLHATTQPGPADAFLIAVPTPFLEACSETAIPEPDLSYIEAAARSIAPVLKAGDLVILESTSPVGTTEKVAEWMAELRPDLAFPQSLSGEADICIAHCPERVLPGQVMRELVQNDRVIGGITGRCSEAAAALYRAFVDGECIITNARTAEMCKLAENSFRDVNIAFANELSMICDKLGINVWELIKLANRHPRVNVLQPGPGVGGHCIAVDPWFIVSKTPGLAHLIQTARLVNDRKPRWVLEKVQLAVAKFVQANPRKIVAADITIACFGLTFKANIDDLRQSPASEIAQMIREFHSGSIVAVEPNIDALPANWKCGIRLASLSEALAVADIILLLVDHELFFDVPWSALQNKIIIDTRGIWGECKEIPAPLVMN